MADFGTLYVLATPLGNLEDVTLRALSTLKECDLVAAEDTRRTSKLLNHYGIKKKFVSYREENHKRVLPKIIKALNSGSDVALVSDAGTPGVSDPGVFLIEAAYENGFKVLPIPGPSAVAGALSVSGFIGSSFIFLGFLPTKKSARQKIWEDLKNETRTVLFFEAPHRILKTIEEAALTLPSRKAVICREMTKINEQYLRGTISDLAEYLKSNPDKIRGEFTVVLDGAADSSDDLLSPAELVKAVVGDDRPIREIAADLADLTDLNRSRLYKLILDVRNEE